MTDECSKRVAIIGAGISGLVSIKACLEEGLIPTAFEQFEYIGGLWNFMQMPRTGQGAAVYENLLLNTSRYITAFSDFPFPDQTLPHYVTHNEVLQYLHAYVDEYHFHKYIRLRCEVLDVRPVPDYDVTGKWAVTYTDLEKDVEENIVYDAVIICSGRYRKLYTPEIPGLERFNGQVIHAGNYRTKGILKDKRVLIVGNASSAGDIAAQAAGFAKQVYLSIGSGTWLYNRFTPGSHVPVDYSVRRLFFMFPKWLINRFLLKQLNNVIDHKRYGLVTEKTQCPGDAVIMINDHLANHIRRGDVVIQGSLKEISENGAEFHDGDVISSLDMICFATGYRPEYSFASDDVLPDYFSKLLLYKMIIPTHLKHATLAMIGGLGIRGPNFCTLEMQARWLAPVLSGKNKLPIRWEMEEECLRTRASLVKRYGYLKYWFDSTSYQDDLACDLGIRPSFWKILFTRPWDLALWYLRPAFPALFRLYGPHRWSGARVELQIAWEARLDPMKKHL